MSNTIISAERDDSGPSVVSLYGQEGAKTGERRNTEVWHVPHSMEPNKPLCNAGLSGRFKRTKGVANCSTCRTCLSLSGFDERYYGVLVALFKGMPVPPYPSKWMDHDVLYQGDLIADVGGKIVITPRGKAVVADVISPASWYDDKTRLHHVRRPVASHTLCGVSTGPYKNIVEHLETLREREKARGRRAPTCVRCAIHIDSPAAW